jgi:hypothetical protein
VTWLKSTPKLFAENTRTQNPYVYPKYLVPVSASYNETIMDFLKKPLEEKIYIQGETIHKTLTKQRSEVTQNGKK